MVKRALSIGIGATLALGAATIPAPAFATGACKPDPLESTCNVLDDCDVVGSLYSTLPPADAVARFRTCLFTDRSYDVAPTDTGLVAQKRRAPLLHIYESSFWPLYCHALERAGQRDRSICERRSASSASSRKKSAARRHHRRRTAPRFTG